MFKNSDYVRKNMNAILYSAPIKIGKTYWFTYGDVIYCFEQDRFKIEKVQELHIPDIHPNAYCYMTGADNQIIFSPFYAKDIAVYDTRTGSIQYIDWGYKNRYAYYRNVAAYGGKIFLLPGVMDGDIIVVDERKKIRHIRIADWNCNTQRSEWTSESVIQGRYLWVTAHYSSQILKLDMDTEQYEFCQTHGHATGYTGIAADRDILWLAESATGAIVKYQIQTGDTEIFQAPDTLGCCKTGKKYVHSGLYDFDNYVVTIPALSDQMTALNKQTGECRTVDTDFFDPVTKDGRYQYENSSLCSFGTKADDATLWVQRALDGEIACMTVGDTFSYHTFSLRLDPLHMSGMRERIYSCDGEIFLENDLTTLNSLLFYIKNTGTDNGMQGVSGVGPRIWEKLKTRE